MPQRFQRITPFLWFDDQAEEAARHYVSIFDDARIVHVARYDEAMARASGREPGSAMTVAFQLDGQDFTALNGGPQFRFTEAISLVVSCRSQEEVDRYWSRLSDGGSEQPCGWLKDRFGLSWQVVPTALVELLNDRDAARARRVAEAMFGMTKLDVAALRNAAG